MKNQKLRTRPCVAGMQEYLYLRTNPDASATAMKEFRLRPNGFKEIRKKALVFTVPVLVLAAAAAVLITDISSRKDPDSINVLPFTIPVMLLIVGFRIYRVLKKQRALLETYTLTITDTIIGREQANTPTIAIPLNDVRVIEKRKNGGFVVRGNKNRDIIYVPAQLERYDELEAALNGIQPVMTGNTEPRWKRIRLLVPLLLIPSLVVVFTAEGKFLVVLSGTAVLAVMGWSVYEGQRSKNIDRSSKRQMVWAIALMVFVAVMVVAKLIA